MFHRLRIADLRNGSGNQMRETGSSDDENRVLLCEEAKHTISLMLDANNLRVDVRDLSEF